MNTCCVIGCGNVGTAICYGLLLKNSFHTIHMIDIDKIRLKAEVADLTQAARVLGSKVEFEAIEEPREADFYILVCGRAGDDDRTKLYETNAPIIEEYSAKIAKVRHEKSVILIVSNPSTRLAQDALRHNPVVIPIGNRLDNARLKMCRASGAHEKPDIQGKYLDVKEGKGYTSFAPASEVLKIISEFGYGFEYG